MQFDGVNKAEISYGRNGKKIAVKWEKENGKTKLTVKNKGFKCVFRHKGQEKTINEESEFFID